MADNNNIDKGDTEDKSESGEINTDENNDAGNGGIYNIEDETEERRTDGSEENTREEETGVRRTDGSEENTRDDETEERRTDGSEENTRDDETEVRTTDGSEENTRDDETEVRRTDGSEENTREEESKESRTDGSEENTRGDETEVRRTDGSEENTREEESKESRTDGSEENTRGGETEVRRTDGSEENTREEETEVRRTDGSEENTREEESKESRTDGSEENTRKDKTEKEEAERNVEIKGAEGRENAEMQAEEGGGVKVEEIAGHDGEETEGRYEEENMISEDSLQSRQVSYITSKPVPPDMSKLEGKDSEILDDDDHQNKTFPNLALNISWSFGYNKHIPVQNLTDENRSMIVYASSHISVMFDYESNKQWILQGHANSITCIYVSQNKKWLVTADKGKDSAVIIWDTYSYIPVQTLFGASADGVTAIALTPDSKYLATLSASEFQEFSLWDWTINGEKPLTSVNLTPTYGVQNYIYFNPEDFNEIVTNSDSHVIFYQLMEWNVELKWFCPELTDQDFNVQIGKYSQSIFQYMKNRALTATSLGNLVIWETKTSHVEGEITYVANKKALKIIKLVTSGINVLSVMYNNIVIGDMEGRVSFFNQKLMLMHRYSNFDLGPVNFISFCPLSKNIQHPEKYPRSCTLAGEPFISPDFILSSTKALCGLVKAEGPIITVHCDSNRDSAAIFSMLRDHVKAPPLVHVIHIGAALELKCNRQLGVISAANNMSGLIKKDHGSIVPAIVTHPYKPYLLTGCHGGFLRLCDYEKKIILASRQYENMMIQCCVYSPDGCYIGVGFTNGMIYLLDALTLTNNDTDIHHYCTDCITHIAFSEQSKYLAIADSGYAVCLLQKEGDTFHYIGRYRSHYQPIRDLMFRENFQSTVPVLLSLGEDRRLVEYDILPDYADGVQLLSVDRIEQSAIPLCMAWYPSFTKESFFFTVNNEYKYKLYNASTKMCRQTILSPTCGSPLTKIIVLPKRNLDANSKYMAFITTDKIGLQVLPVDGNRHKSTAFIAHPDGVANIAASCDGRYLFTTSQKDASLHMWNLNISALEAQVKLGGEDLIPFYELINGGREGDVFQDLEKYFYYSQLRCSGIDSIDTRPVATTITITEIPFVLRAMGFYPTEEELANIVNEVKFTDYVDTEQFKEDINIGDFLKLLINHRPLVPPSTGQLQWAFDTLVTCEDEEGKASLSTEELLDILQTEGEHIRSDELCEILACLSLPVTSETDYHDKTRMTSQLNEEELIQRICEKLPESLTAPEFASKLLGLVGLEF